MNVNIEIVFLDFLKNDFLDVGGLWFVQQTFQTFPLPHICFHTMKSRSCIIIMYFWNVQYLW